MPRQTREKGETAATKSSAFGPMQTEEWESLLASGRETFDNLGQWLKVLKRQAEERPGRAVGVAIGAGFLLGGGLFSRLALRALGLATKLGVRLALAPIAVRGVMALTDLAPPRGEPIDVGTQH